MTLAFRALLSLCLVLCCMARAGAQTPGASASGQASAEFVTSAYSSALLQQKAAEIAAASDIRPEARQYAQDMAGFRSAQLQRLATLAAESKATLPAAPNFEQQVLIDNLKPLEFLALARRYMELQVQTLEQEIGAYATVRADEPVLGPFVGEYLPLLRERLAQGREVLQAVGL